MVFEKVREILMDQLDVEEEFDCEIPDEEIENIKTVGDIVHYIESKQE